MKPTKKALTQRIQDIITGVYGAPFNPDDNSSIMTMGDPSQFYQLLSCINKAFPELERAKGISDWTVACMPWNMDEWTTPEDLASFLLTLWGAE